MLKQSESLICYICAHASVCECASVCVWEGSLNGVVQLFVVKFNKEINLFGRIFFEVFVKTSSLVYSKKKNLSCLL